jgi:hypothetical protein
MGTNDWAKKASKKWNPNFTQKTDKKSYLALGLCTTNKVYNSIISRKSVIDGLLQPPSLTCRLTIFFLTGNHLLPEFRVYIAKNMKHNMYICQCPQHHKTWSYVSFITFVHTESESFIYNSYNHVLEKNAAFC